MATQFRTLTTAAALAAAALMLTGQQASAQGTAPQAPLPSTTMAPLPSAETVTMQAKITAINPQTREVTLKGASGASVKMTAGPNVRLELLKVGDTVNAKYYRSVAFLLGTPGTPAPEDAMATVVAQKASGPGGAAMRVTRISATVVGIDLADHTVDVIDPTGGLVRTITVTDPSRMALLTQVKVGDTITAAVGESLAVEITPAPKSWF